MHHDIVSKEVPRYPVPEDIQINGKEKKDEEDHYEGQYGHARNIDDQEDHQIKEAVVGDDRMRSWSPVKIEICGENKEDTCGGRKPQFNEIRKTFIKEGQG